MTMTSGESNRLQTQTVTFDVVIPVFNAGMYLQSCVDSVLSQTWRDFHLYIVDNCSTDDCTAFLSNYTDPRISLTRSTRTVSAAENWTLGTRQGSSRWVKLLCADDLLAPDCLEQEYSLLAQYDEDEVAAVFGWRSLATSGGVKLPSLRKPREISIWKFEDIVSAATKSGGNPIGEPLNVTFRRSAIETSLPWREGAGYCLDLDMWLRLAQRGKFLQGRHQTGWFRVHRDSWTSRAFKTQYRSLRDCLASFGVSEVPIMNALIMRLRPILRNLASLFFSLIAR